MSNTAIIRPDQHIYTFGLLCLCILLLPLTAGSTVIVDAEGTEITVEKPYTHIISLYPAHTENLVSLGASQELIGISRSDNFPESIAAKPRFSYHDNVEKFLAATPDLILIRPMISRSQPELIAKLRQAGITIVSLQPTSVDEMFVYWRHLASLTGRETACEKMIERFMSELEQSRQLIPKDPALRPNVYFEAIHAKMKTFSPSAIAMFVLDQAGGKNIADDAKARNNSNIAPYGKERLLSRGEKIDVFISQVGRMNRVAIKDIFEEPGFQLIRAVREKRVFLVEEELVSRPTMRLLFGVEKIRSFLYPKA